MKKSSVIRRFVNSVLNRRMEESARGRAPKGRALRLEALESRELLSVNPIGNDNEQVDFACNAVLEPIDLSGLMDEGDYGVGEYEVANAVTGKTWVVTSAEDDGSESTLRYAINSADNGDTITFDSSLKGGTITLNGTQLEITKSITIDASALWDETNEAPGIAVDANSRSRVFSVVASAEVSFNALTIQGGQVEGNGAGVIINGIGYFYDCFISNNEADSCGGGVFVASSGRSFFENCVVSENFSSGYGGGICSEGTASLENCVITKNGVSEWWGEGGGALFWGDFTIVNSIIAENSAYSGGGLFLYGNSNGTVVNSLIYGNMAIGKDYDWEYDEETEEEIEVEIQIGYGGGIYIDGADEEVLFVNCTITENAAYSEGAGIYANYVDNASIRNSIVVNNRTTSGITDEINGCNGNLNANRTLSTYANWENASETGVVNYKYDPSSPLFTNADNHDYTLDPLSQAIYKGDNSYVTTETDLALAPRIVGGIVDLGAYECQAGVLEIPSTIVTTTQDVVDPTDGYISLREAINKYAATGDTITFDASLKGQTITLNGEQLEIDKSITIDATSIYNTESNEPGITIDADGKSRIFYAKDVSGDVGFIGLSITKGFHKRNDGASEGGAVCIVGGKSKAIFTNCVISNSSATSDRYVTYGGGVYVYGSASLTDCFFSGNQASFGAAVSIKTSSAASAVSIERCVFRNNSGQEALEIDEVGSQGSVSINDCIITENKGYGLSLRLNNSTTTTVANCTITGNSGYYGAGVSTSGNSMGYSWNNVKSATASFINCEITGNTSKDQYGGGAAIHSGTKGVFTNCTISDNASKYGGGVFVDGTDSTAVLTNCLVTGNDAKYSGGGIYATGTSSTISLTNCTVSDNSAPNGSALYFNSTAIGDVKNSIVVAGNSSDSAEEVYCEVNNDQQAVVNAYNTISSFTQWSNANEEDVVNYEYDSNAPLFTNSDGYVLSENSQAINKGENAYVSFETDISGSSRIEGGKVDLGAYEYIENASTKTPLDSVAITGDLSSGSTLTATIIPREASATYQWFRGTSPSATTWTTINGATSSTYKLTDDDAGKYIKVVVAGIGNYSNTTSDVSSSHITKTWVVTSIEDNEATQGTLRYAIKYSSEGDTITFASDLKGKTIVLNGKQLAIDKSITIDASNLYDDDAHLPGITIDGNASSRIFYLTGDSVNIIGLGIANGKETKASGGGVYVYSGAGFFTDCLITGNYASPDGGGIAVAKDANLTAFNTVFTNNISVDQKLQYGTSVACGGAIYSRGNTKLVNCLVNNNNSRDGGGIYILGYSTSPTTATIVNCTIANNLSTEGGNDLSIRLDVEEDVEIVNSIVPDVHLYSIGSYGSTPDSVRFYNSLSESFNLPNVSAWTNIIEPGVVNYEYDPNQPLFTDAANGDYTLAEGSQAVNRGRQRLRNRVDGSRRKRTHSKGNRRLGRV